MLCFHSRLRANQLTVISCGKLTTLEPVEASSNNCLSLAKLLKIIVLRMVESKDPNFFLSVGTPRMCTQLVARPRYSNVISCVKIYVEESWNVPCQAGMELIFFIAVLLVAAFAFVVKSW